MELRADQGSRAGTRPSQSRQLLKTLQTRLLGALSSCATEADMVQVLYAELHVVFGYAIVNLQVLEREGWYHSLAIDQGVLQDARRRLLVESYFARLYDDPRPHVLEPPPDIDYLPSRGPGSDQRPRVVIWVPLLNGGVTVGAVSYQFHEQREVRPPELQLLEAVHAQLGILVSNAYLNQLTRNQALRLDALNRIARALSTTHDAEGVVRALLATLSAQIPVDALELAVSEEETPNRARLIRLGLDGRLASSTVPVGSGRLGRIRDVLDTGRPLLGVEASPDGAPVSMASVAVPEGDEPRGVLTARRRGVAYEESTLAFLEQVADQVSLALRNARSYAAVEAQRRRLEVVDAVGRRLASSLDRWSIMHTLREALSRHLEFDLFALAAVSESPEGPVAEGYIWDSGHERLAAPVPLAAAGPSREAYESGHSVLIRRSPWASWIEAGPRSGGDRLIGEGVVIDVTRPGRHRRVATRSIIWVPVRQGEEVTALVTLQSYRADVFNEWHVRVLEDVAAHVGVALANADHFQTAQSDRHRLEALHLLEMGVAGAADEAEIAEAVFNALRGLLEAPSLMLTFLDSQGRLTGYSSEPGPRTRKLDPLGLQSTRYFRRLQADRATIAEAVPDQLRGAGPDRDWPTWGTFVPSHVLGVPLFNDKSQVVGALSAQRREDAPFTPEQIQLLESAGPVVGMALRSVRLHRANELALAHSVRLQMVAGLAGHDLATVLDSVAEQARVMLEATGTACWAFDIEGRVTGQAARGRGAARRVLRWAGRSPARSWVAAPRAAIVGAEGSLTWTLIPLWYGDRLVGALGSVHPPGAITDEPQVAAADFAHHAAIAIENARLAAETMGNIRALETVALFANLDIAQPERARAELARLIEVALSDSRGALWLLEGATMVRGGLAAPATIGGGRPEWWGPALQRSRAGHASRRLRNLVRAAAESGQVSDGIGRGAVAHPVLIEGQVVGMVTADAAAAVGSDTRRLVEVLAGQAALVLSRLRLVAEVNSEKEMLARVLHHSPVGVVLEDEAGQVVYANPEVEKVYGVAAESLPGTPARDLHQRADAFVVVDPEAEPGGPLEVRLRDRDPEVVVQIRRVPIPGTAGQPPRVLTLHENVTTQRNILEAKDLTLRAIGHELRSPAAQMRSTLASLMQWGTVMDRDQRHTLLAEAYEQSDHLLSQVENQLLISRLERWRFEPRPVSMGLPRVLERVLAVLRNRYGDRVNVVDARVSPELPDAYCEPTHLDQVLSNLLGNALEYTRARRVRIEALAEAGWLEITVSDDGAGLPRERRDNVFAKSAPAGQNRARGGLGLGLYLCRLVVERSFGGRIWLASTGPEGTTFKFTVPAAVARAHPRAARTTGRRAG